MKSDTSMVSDAEKLRVTIKDVAKAAGVSIATASKALNDRGRMTPDTRQRIREVARSLGFTPNAMARALVSQRSFTIGLLTNDTYGRFTLPVAAGLSDALIDRGVSVFLCAFENDPERAELNLRAMLDKQVDGLVIAGKRIDRALPLDLSRVNVPVVHVNSACEETEIGFVPDDYGSAMNAVTHLVDQGCLRIAHVSGPKTFRAVELRAEGWRAALQKAGLRPFGALKSGDWSEAFGFECGQKILDAPLAKRPDGVFCGNDQIARGLIDALRLGGLRVPEDIAVVGFDNWEVVAKATRPPLTTIDMGLNELGRRAGMTLLDLIAGNPVAPGVRRLPCRLVVRASSMRLNATGFGDDV